VHDAVRVREGHGVEDPRVGVQPILERRLARHELVETPSAHELHHIEGAAVGQRAGVVDGNDGGMIEPGQDVRFALQPRGARSVLVGDVEHLHRDLAVEHPIAGDVDGAHAAVAGDARDRVARIQLGPRRRLS
jgi:hypothetical protein